MKKLLKRCLICDDDLILLLTQQNSNHYIGQFNPSITNIRHNTTLTCLQKTGMTTRLGVNIINVTKAIGPAVSITKRCQTK
nr:hypothetical transcript [Hymenolepis microstoma]